MKQKLISTFALTSAVLAAPLITGKILSPNGNPIPNIIVQLKSTLEKDTTDATGTYALGNSSSSLSSSVNSSSSSGTVSLRTDKNFVIHQNGNQLSINLGQVGNLEVALFDAQGSLIQNLFTGKTEQVKLSLPRTAGVQFLRMNIQGQLSTHMLVNGILQNQQFLLSNPNMGLGLAANDTLILSNGSTPMFKVGISAGIATIPDIFAVRQILSGSFSGGMPEQLKVYGSRQDGVTDIRYITPITSPFSLEQWKQWTANYNWQTVILAFTMGGTLLGYSQTLNHVDSTSQLNFAPFTITAGNSSSLSSNASSSSFLSSSSSSSSLSSSSVASSSSAGFSYGSLVDSRDSKTYKTIMIGNQEWMAQNLNYGTFTSANSLQFSAQKYCYSNSSSACDSLGGLYQWHTMLGVDSSYALNSLNPTSAEVQGICPVGWHIPRTAEWDTLVNRFGGNTLAGQSLKLKPTAYPTWDAATYNDGNSSHFGAYPSGIRNPAASFASLGQMAYFWELEEYNANYAWNRSLSNYSTSVNHASMDKRFAYALRCAKNRLSSSSGISSSLTSSSSAMLSSSSALSSSSTGGLSYGSLYDSRDGQSYKTIVIGSQTWMAENLNYGTMIYHSNLQAPAQKFCRGDIDSNCSKYGGYYQWHTAMGISLPSESSPYTVPTSGNIQGICPVGWHIPRPLDWYNLGLNVGNNTYPGTMMKLNNTGYNNTYGWDAQTYNYGNPSGFSAYPAGRLIRINSGTVYFESLGSMALFWVAELQDMRSAYARYLSSDSPNLSFYPENMQSGLQVRCLKD